MLDSVKFVHTKALTASVAKTTVRAWVESQLSVLCWSLRSDALKALCYLSSWKKCAIEIEARLNVTQLGVGPN